MDKGILVKGDRAYNMTVQTLSRSQQVTIQAGCFAFMFTNRGDAIANVNGIVINPSPTPATALGESRSISGHDGDIYRGPITLTIAPGGAAPLVEIIQLFYTDYQ